MARNRRQQLLSFLFDLSFSLTCDTQYLTDYCELIGRLILTPQLVSLVVPTAMRSWSSPRLQQALQWFLFSFGTRTELHMLLALTIVYFLLIARVSWDVYHQGVAPSSRYLRMARLLHAACSTFFFVPICYNFVVVLNWIAHNMPNFPPNEVPAWTAQLLVFSIILTFCFLIPMMALAALNTPNYNSLTFMTRISSRQQVLTLLIQFTTCLCAGVVSDLFARMHILAVLITALFFLAFNFPYFGSGFGNVFAILTLAVPTYVSWLSVALVWTSNPYAAGSDSQYYHIGSIGFFPFASVCVALYMLRIRRIVNTSSYWKQELKNLGRYWSVVTKAKQYRIKNQDEDVLPDLNPAIILHNCASARDVALVSHMLLFVSHKKYVPQILEFLALSFKKYPESVLIQETAVAIEAFFTQNTAHHRQSVQGTIRRLLGRNLVLPDTQFQFYKVIKFQEIATYRQQDDLRKASSLDVARYIHNFQSAQSHHTKALQWAVRFWRICSADRPNLDTADFASNSIQIHQSTALKHYKNLLDNFPTSVVVLRTYASFVSECLNHQELAESILDYSIKLSEDRAEIIGTATEGSKVSAPALTRTLSTTPDKKRPGSRGSDVEDSHSEMTKSSAGNTIDSLSTVDSSSIFDVEGTEESRNTVAMKGVRRLVLNVVLSFVLLLAGINVVFGMGNIFKSRELSDRNNILDAGLVRLGVLEIAWNARSMDLLLHNLTSFATPQQTIPYLQRQLTAVAFNASTAISSIFGRTAESSSTSLLTYWQTPVITDPTVATQLTPAQFLSHVFFKSLRLGSADASSLAGDHADVNWLVANGLPDALLTFVLGFVKVFQLFYEENVRFRTNSLVASIIAISVIPVVSFLVFFLPVWLRLSSELNASRRLFTHIPRRVAGVLCKEMQECLKEQLEREGADGTDVIREKDATNDSEQGNSASHLSETRGSDDDWNNQFGPERPGSRHLTMWRLLGMYVLTLLVIMGLGIGLAFCYIRPLELGHNRGSVINFSGLRLSMAVRSMTELRELSMLPPDDEQAEALRANILAHVDDAIQYHSWTLYGNPEEGLPRTFGNVPEADMLTFSRTCPPTNASAACMSVEEAFVTFASIARRVVDRRLSVTEQDYNVAALIAEPQGILRNPILKARLIYSELNQNQFNMAEIASIVLFSATFPSLFIVAYVLYRPLDDVAKMIRRVRGILFQLPTETLDPSIRDYLDHGWLRMNGKSWQGKKSRDSEVNGENKNTRLHAVNEANRRLQEEGVQWDIKNSQDGTGRQRKVKMMDAAADSEAQAAESLVIERMRTKRSSSRAKWRPMDVETAGTDDGSKVQLNMSGKEVSASAALSPTSPTGLNGTFTRHQISLSVTQEQPGSLKATTTRADASLGSAQFAGSAHLQPPPAVDQAFAAQSPLSTLHRQSDARSSDSLSVPNSAQRLDVTGSNAPTNPSLSNRPTLPRPLGMTRNGSGNGSFVRDVNQLPHMLHSPGGSMQRDMSAGSRHGSLSRLGTAGVVISSRLMNSMQRRAVTAAATAVASQNENDSGEDDQP